MIRIGFFGTPELSRDVLMDILYASDMEVVCVITNPDTPYGRDQVMRSTPVRILAQERNIPVFTPTKIRENTEFFDILRTFDCDYFIVVAYGRILPLELLEIPKKQSVNIHGSILPKYRWASPIQSALLHGEKETGVTIMKMSAGMDEGDILKIRTISIDPSETTLTLFEKFSKLAWPTLIQTIRELEAGGITSLPQDPAEATYCKKIEKEDGCVDWSKSARDIYHMWQAYTPWPGIYTMYEGKRFLLEQVHKYDWTLIRSWGVGEVIKLDDGSIWIICGEWILTLDQVKLEWKKSQNIKDFVNGNQKFINSVL